LREFQPFGGGLRMPFCLTFGGIPIIDMRLIFYLDFRRKLDDTAFR
jgi:hypothetical protein